MLNSLFRLTHPFYLWTRNTKNMDFITHRGVWTQHNVSPYLHGVQRFRFLCSPGNQREYLVIMINPANFDYSLKPTLEYVQDMYR